MQKVGEELIENAMVLVLTEGQRFKILIENSKIPKNKIAERLGIVPESLSRIFKRQKLSDEMRSAAAELFGVPESYFAGDPPLDVVNEPDAPYKPPSEQLAKREREIEVLKEELEMMRQRLVEQKNLTDEQANELERLRRMLKGE